jgi:uncharacterized protein YuzE
VQFEHDHDADAAYVQINSAEKVTRTKQLDPNRMVDYGADGTIVGIEFLNVSSGVDLTGLPHHDKLTRLFERNHIRLFA